MDRAVRRAGAGAAIVGAVLGFVFNLLHPRGSVVNVTDELRLVSESQIWLLDHFGLMVAIGLSVIGLVVIGRSLDKEPAGSWGRLAAASAVLGGSVALVTLFVDGMANYAVATEWAASQSAASLAAGTAVAQISLALFTGIMPTFFGITPVLFGIAVMSSDEHPNWLGYLALLAGLLGILTGSIQFLNGVAPLTADILFPISSIAFTLWTLIMGWRLWSRSAAPAAVTPPTPETPEGSAA